MMILRLVVRATSRWAVEIHLRRMVSVCEKRLIVATESRCSGLRVGLARRVSLHWQARARARALFKFAQAPWARSETLSNHVLLNNAVTSSNKLYEGTYGTY